MKDQPRKAPRSPGQWQQPQQPQQQQPQDGEGKQYGEGNYKATRDYDQGLKQHMQTHDVEKEARDAAPRSDAEAREMQRAEEAGRSRARGDSKEKPEDPSER